MVGRLPRALPWAEGSHSFGVKTNVEAVAAPFLGGLHLTRGERSLFSQPLFHKGNAMRSRTALLFGLSMFAAISCGCGTLNNLPPPGPAPLLDPGDPGSRTYGGVRAELECFRVSKCDPEDTHPKKEISKLFLPAVIVDLPFTLIGDTITLPYTLAYDCGLFGKICILRYPKSRGEDPHEIIE